MKLFGKTRVWVGVAAAVLLAMGAIVASGSASYAAPTTPIQASISGSLTPTGETTFTLVGNGIASQLGKVSYSAQAIITSGVPGDEVITDTLTETLVAPNGDTFTLLCEQEAHQVSPGVYLGTDSWTVIGGTGRFAGATGSGTGETHIDLNAGTFSKQMSGTIAW